MDNGKVYAKCEERALRIYIVRCSMNGLKEQKLNGSIVYTKTHSENDILAWVDAKNKIWLLH